MKKIILILFISAISVDARTRFNERYYQARFNKEVGGREEVRLPDGTRCDVVTKDFAIEVDFARKWYEAFGQSLWYAMQTGKRPAVLLILKKDDDYLYAVKLNTLAKHHNIELTIWTVIRKNRKLHYHRFNARDQA